RSRIVSAGLSANNPASTLAAKAVRAQPAPVTFVATPGDTRTPCLLNSGSNRPYLGRRGRRLERTDARTQRFSAALSHAGEKPSKRRTSAPTPRPGRTRGSGVLVEVALHPRRPNMLMREPLTSDRLRA